MRSSILLPLLAVAWTLQSCTEAFHMHASGFSRIHPLASVVRRTSPLQLRMSGQSRANQNKFSSSPNYAGTLFPLMSTISLTPPTKQDLDPEHLALEAEHVSIDFNKRLGSGTYGDVFEASITAGPDKGMRVVVKRPRHSDDAQDFSSEGVNKEGFIEGGADHNAMCESMLEVESYMGKKTSEACPQVVPRFLGDLSAHDSKWLVWEHVGSESLESLFQRASDAGSLKLVADALGVADFEDGSWKSLATLVEEIARQLFECVWALENAGIAHRDIKPENVLVSPQKRLLLIDFGSAACMGEAPYVGYDYNMAPCDADYCPPERFIDEAEWNKYDVYSCALVLLRVLMKPLLTGQQYRTFRDTLFSVDNDLDHFFSFLILSDPAVQAIRAEPPFGLAPQDRIKEYERLAGLSCALEEAPLAHMSLCLLHEGLTVLKNRFGFRYETLQALLSQEPGDRPTAREALYSLG